MKKNIFNSFIAGACILALASCDDNSWNNEYLNGFEDNPAITDIQSIEYTLTDADYSAIASNSTNKAKADADSVSAALKAVGTQHYFTADVEAKDYIPAFLGDSKFPYFVLDNGSAVKVTYKVATNLPAEVTAAAAAEQYKVTDEDYQAVWGSEDYVASFTPSHSADKNIPNILKAAYPDAKAGQYVIVNYNNATSEPVFGGVEAPEEVTYTHNKVTAITSGRSYILAADVNAATAVPEGKGYGYLGVTTVAPEAKGLNAEDAATIEFRFEAASAGKFYIIDAYDRYLYMKGTYNNFNVSKSVPAEGGEWTVAANSDGTLTITNVMNGKTLQYDAQYNSYGAYDTVKGAYPAAYEKANDYTSVIGTVVKGETYEITGVVSGLCAQGYLLTDNSGTILVYYGKSYDVASHNIGDIVKINGEIGSYNKGLQVVGSSATEEIIGATAYKFPTPVVMKGADLDAEIANRTADGLAKYVSFTGTVSVSGNYVNIIVDGATAQGSPYQLTAEQKALFTDGSIVDLKGWYIAISGGKYISIVVTELATANATLSLRSLVADVAKVEENAVYYFDGSKWTVPANFSILSPADYTAMGQKYGNLSTSAKPEVYLPVYLKTTYPYAQAEDAMFVLYKYYDGSATNYRCDQYVYNGAAWDLNNGVIEESAQFVKNAGKWMFDPNVTITLPNGGSYDICKLYYQACVDWVYENIDKPLGSTDIKSGKFYVSSYGNNEYYSGTSAYYGNVDIRADKAIGQYPAGFEGMSNEEVVELMKTRFCNEVMPGALAKIHPDAMPVEGLQVIYSIDFAAYTGSTTMHTVRYEVTAPGEFTFIDCTWFE